MAGKTILVASDLSPRADRAVDRAFQLGTELRLPVTLLHVLGEAQDSPDAREKARKAARAVLPDPAAEAEIVIAEGSAPEVIAETAAERKAELVLTGASRFNSLGDYVLGTAVDNLVRRSRVPVLVAKHRPHAPYGRIVCAVDCSEHSARALAVALRLFPGREISAVYAYHVGYEGWQRDAYVYDETRASAEKAMAEFIAGLPVAGADRERVRASVGYGDVSEVLASEIAAKDPDLLVLGTHGASGFRHATLGSTAAWLLNWAEPDTLVVPPE